MTPEIIGDQPQAGGNWLLTSIEIVLQGTESETNSSPRNVQLGRDVPTVMAVVQDSHHCHTDKTMWYLLMP